ncbi:alpha-protein kinase 1-like [Daphnia pulicaria]|nr:alpha-protein kinase 1-like [Daphnia pulicaria]
MSYRQIEKLAKEKPNITRRDRVSEEILIEVQHSQNLHSDSHFISTDETTDDSTMESEVVQEPTVSKCGRKHGNQNSKEEQKALPVSKKTKESVDHASNSTFSIDEQMFQQQQNQLLEKQQQQQQQLQEQQQQQQLQEQQQLQIQL